MSGGGRRRGGSSWPSFSRFFTPRGPSRDQDEAEEEKPAAVQPPTRGAPSPSKEPVIISQKKENASSTEPVKISQSEDSRSHSEKPANLSPEEDTKKLDDFTSLPSDSKTLDIDKQPKEGFLQFLGNLFNISAKSLQQLPLKGEHDKTEKDSQNLIVLHKEKFKKENYDLRYSPPLEELSPTIEKKGLPTSTDTSDVISEDIREDSEQESNELLKNVECEPEIPSTTYSTYRGPRQILKIIRKQTKLETSTSAQKADETSDSSTSTQTGNESESEAAISPNSPINYEADLLKSPLKHVILNNSNYKECKRSGPSSSTESNSSSIVESCYKHPLNCVPVYKTDNIIASVLIENDTKDSRNPAFQRCVNPKTTLENNFLNNGRASEQRGEYIQHMNEENKPVIQDLQINMQVKESTKAKEISTSGLPSPDNTLCAKNEMVGSLPKDTDYIVTTKNESFDSGSSVKVSQGIIIIQNDHPSLQSVKESEKADCVQNSITPKLKVEVFNRNHISGSSFESKNPELAKVLISSSDVNNKKTSPILECEKTDSYDCTPTFDSESGIFGKWEAPILKNMRPCTEYEQNKIVHSATPREINLVLHDFDSEEIYQAEISPSDLKFKDIHLMAIPQSYHRAPNESPLVFESGVVEDLLCGPDSKAIESVTYDNENTTYLGSHEPGDIDDTHIISDQSGMGLSSSNMLPKSQQDDSTLQFTAKTSSKLKAKSSLEVSSMLRSEETASFERHYEKNNLLGDSSKSISSSIGKPEEANTDMNSSKPNDNFEILKAAPDLTCEDTSLVMMISANSPWEFEKANQVVTKKTCHRYGREVPKIHTGKLGLNYLTAAVLKNAIEADAQTVASATVSVNSSSQQCSEASAEDTETRKRAHDKSLDSNSGLLEKADKLIGVSLSSDRQEPKSLEIGVNYADCNAGTLTEEATGIKTSKEKVKALIQLPDHLDECSVENVAEDKREEKAHVLTTIGERNLITDIDKMDVNDFLIIKAKELVSEVIHRAQQIVRNDHYRKTKSRSHTRDSEKANATKILSSDIIIPLYVDREFLALEEPECQSITKVRENKESESLLAKINLDNNTNSTKGTEIAPHPKTSCAGNGLGQFDSVELPEPDVLLSENTSHKDLDDKGLPLACNKEESKGERVPSQLECMGNHKTQTEDPATFVLNLKWTPFINDEVYTHLPSTSKGSFSDSVVCINEKCLPGHSNKPLPTAMLDMGTVYRKDAELSLGNIEVEPSMLEMGKVFKKSPELNVGRSELMPSLLEMGRAYAIHADLNAGKNELMPSILEMGKSYKKSGLNLLKVEGTPDSFKMEKPYKRNSDEMTPVRLETEKAFQKDIEGNVEKASVTFPKLKIEKTCKDDTNVTQTDLAITSTLGTGKKSQKIVEGNIRESKVKPAIFEVGKIYQMNTEGNLGKIEMRPIEIMENVAPGDKNTKSQIEEYELPTLSQDCKVNIGFMTPDFLPEDSKLRTEKNLYMTGVYEKERNLGYDCANEQPHLAFIPQDEQSNPSFTILYEEPLQDEAQYLSAEEEGAHSLGFPDESTNSLQPVLVCERSESRTDLVHHFEKESKSSEMFDNDNSEMFLSVEAKRYKVYPLALSPIYEDDSPQDDILSNEVSPGHRGSSAKSRDGSGQPSSVLSLLQSVSERLRMNFDDGEKLEAEEEEIVDEDEEGMQQKDNILKTGKREHITFQLPDCSTLIYEGEDQEETKSSKMPLFLSNEATTSNQQTALWQDRASLHPAASPLLQKSDLSTKLHSSFKSAYHQYLQTTKSVSPEKGAKFGSILQEPVPRLNTYPEDSFDKQSLKCNPRPGKMVIYDLHGSKYKQEIYNDILDAASWTFPNGAFIRVVRGCWILYEKPHFQGHKCVLEEGEKVLNRDWIFRSKKHQTRNFVIGSIKRVLKDCTVPEIELCPQSDAACCPIYVQKSVANLEDLNLPRSVSFAVKSGVWLAYTDVNFKGQMTILEEGHGLFEISASEIKSLYSLQMGGLKVEMPMNLKVIIYDKTHFLGHAKEFNEHVDSVPELFKKEEIFFGIASIRVIGGVWVAYEKERFKGQQYLLEEGEYEDISTWQTLTSTLLSFRYLQANFIESSVTLFEDTVENSKFVNIINREVPDLEEVGFGSETRCIHVKSGVWVGYQQRFYCGEQYILEKGKYKSFFDWGGVNNQIMSIRPVRLEPLGINEPPYLLKAYDQPNFQGNCVDFTGHISDLTAFTPHSFKVLRGSWLMHCQGDFTSNQCVLEEGLYADLTSCGCSPAQVKSLKPIKYVFEEPFISLFALEHCEGRELCLGDAINSVLNKDFYFYTQSVWVKSGLWIAYEGSNFLGRQILLEPSEISNWSAFSGWKTIGSLRPVKQPSVYIRIKNRAQGEYLTVTGNLADMRTTSLCISPYNGKNTQVWHYCRGIFKSKANDTCLDVIGGKETAGAKVAVWSEHGRLRQKWKMNKNGTISSYLNDHLVLDIKGGSYCDKTHIIINQPLEGELTQKWDIEIL